jgi:peptidoglycan-associated lipoprotein
MEVVMKKLVCSSFACAPVAALALSLAACATARSEKEPADPADGARMIARKAAIEEMMRNFARVNFEFDSALITDETRDALAANVGIMRRFEEIEVEVEGHCDEQGSTEYNLVLGQRRADAIRKYMVMAGVAADRVETISFGEEAPVDLGMGEGAWSKNRRAEFRVTVDPKDRVHGTVEDLARYEEVDSGRIAAR